MQSNRRKGARRTRGRVFPEQGAEGRVPETGLKERTPRQESSGAGNFPPRAAEMLHRSSLSQTRRWVTLAAGSHGSCNGRRGPRPATPPPPACSSVPVSMTSGRGAAGTAGGSCSTICSGLRRLPGTARPGRGQGHPKGVVFCPRCSHRPPTAGAARKGQRAGWAAGSIPPRNGTRSVQNRGLHGGKGTGATRTCLFHREASEHDKNLTTL